jgi:hypothetical protein
MLHEPGLSALISAWIVGVVVVVKRRHRLDHHGFITFCDQFVDVLEMLLGETLLFEKAASCGNEPSSMDRMALD